MNVYFAIKYHSSLKNRKQTELILKTLESLGIATAFVQRDVEDWSSLRFSPAELMKASFALIDQSDCLLMDISEKGVGLGIEAGYAYAKKIPLTVIAKEYSDVSTTLKGICAGPHFYADERDMVRLIKTLFSQPN